MWHRWLVALALLLVLLFPQSPVGGADDPNANQKHPAFPVGKVWSVQLKLSEKEYAAMQPLGTSRFPGFGPTPPPNPKPDDPNRELHRNTFGVDLPWAQGAVVLGDKTFENVGLRYKGNGTIADAANTIKKSIRIDLDKFESGATFHGSITFNLHCGVTDPSLCRERLGYAVYRAAGVPAPRTCYAEVTLAVPGKFKNELLGVYTMTQHIDKAFLKEHFETDKGLLMKPEGVRDLEYRGDNWESYKKPFAPKRDAKEQEAKRIIAICKLIHRGTDEEFKKSIQDSVDVEGYLRFLAVTAFIANTDNFWTIGHNYQLYLHPKTNKLHFIPWDLDRAFGNFPFMSTAAQQMDMSFTHPYAGYHKLTERILAIPANAERYKTILKELSATCFNSDWLMKETKALQEEIKPLREKEAKAATARKERKGGATGFGGPPPELPTFFEKRLASLVAQLDGTSKGFVPLGGFGVQQTMGEMMAGPMLQARDTNSDKKLSRDEWIATAERLYEASEKDEGKLLTVKTLTAGIDSLMPKPPANAPRGPGLGATLAPAIFKKTDANKDGKLSLVELTDAAKATYDAIDKKKTGQLTETQFAALLDAIFPPVQGPGR